MNNSISITVSAEKRFTPRTNEKGLLPAGISLSTNKKKKIPAQSYSEPAKNEISKNDQFASAQSAQCSSNVSYNAHQMFLNRHKYNAGENVLLKMNETLIQDGFVTSEIKKSSANLKMELNENEIDEDSKKFKNKDSSTSKSDTNDLVKKTSVGSNSNPMRNTLKTPGFEYLKKLGEVKRPSKNVLSFFQSEDISTLVKSTLENNPEIHSKTTKMKFCETATNSLQTGGPEVHNDDDDPELNFSDEEAHPILDGEKISNNQSTPMPEPKESVVHNSEKMPNTGTKSTDLPISNRTERIIEYQFQESSDDLIHKISEPKLMVHAEYGNVKVRWSQINSSNFSSNIANRLCITVKSPKSIQTAIWPGINRGHSVFAVGPGKSGKTLSIISGLCSLIADFDKFDRLPSTKGPLALIICPSNQAVCCLHDICKHLLLNSEIDGRKVKVLKVVNTLSDYQNAFMLKNGCDILITTPSILDLENYKNSHLDLSRLVYFVVENVDILDQEFHEDIWKIYTLCKNAVKCRINKDVDLKIFAESRKWCTLMKKFAETSCNPNVCISALQECIYYSESKINMQFISQKDKVNILFQELIDKQRSNDRTVIVCNKDKEVSLVAEYLKQKHTCVIEAYSTMSLEDNMHINNEWKSFCREMKNVILVCTDRNLIESDIQGTYNLIHFSLPDLFSSFYHRFICLINTIPNMWDRQKSNSPTINVTIYIDEKNQKQLPKLIELANRCEYKFDDQTQQNINMLLNMQEEDKSISHIPLCNELITRGKCYSFTDCKYRHGIVCKIDSLKDWIPPDGFIKFKLLHIYNATHFSIRLIEHVSIDKKITKFSSNCIELSLDILEYYLNDKNRKPFINPKPGDVCCVEHKLSFYRCQIIDVIFKNNKKQISALLVNLIDKEELLECDCTQLYELPDGFKNPTNNVLQIRLVGVIPTGLCVAMDEASKNELINMANEENCFMSGRIVLGINNCLWLDSVNCFQTLKSCRKNIMKLNVVKYLLNKKFVKEHRYHLKMLTELCQKNSFAIPKYYESEIKSVSDKKLVSPKPQWAHLEFEDINEVYISNVISPETFFVKLIKFDDLVTALSADLKKSVENSQKGTSFEKGEIYAVKYNGTFSRARIDSVEPDNCYKCFFVDFGDWMIINSSDIYSIDSRYIQKLPFQAIECRLLAIKSSKDNWDGKSTTLLEDMSFESEDSEYWKKIVALPFIKENPQYTDGSKYAVACFDSTSSLNEKFVLEELALYQESEKKFIEIATSKLEIFLSKEENVENDDYNEDVIEGNNNNDILDKSENKNVVDVLRNKFPEPNITDFDVDDGEFDEEEWDCTFTYEDLLAMQNEPKAIESGMSTDRKLIEIPDNVSEANIDQLFKSSKSNEMNQSTKNAKDNLIDKKVIKPFQSPSHKCPCIRWREDNDTVFLKVDLVGVEDYTLNISADSLYFYTCLRGDIYEFNLDLSGGVKKSASTHSAKGQYIYIKLAKLVKKRKWEELEKGHQRKLIKYDVDHCSSSDEDEKELNDSDKKMIDAEKVKIIYDALYNNSSDEDEVDYNPDENDSRR